MIGHMCTAVGRSVEWAGSCSNYDQRHRCHNTDRMVWPRSRYEHHIVSTRISFCKLSVCSKPSSPHSCGYRVGWTGGISVWRSSVARRGRLSHTPEGRNRWMPECHSGRCDAVLGYPYLPNMKFQLNRYIECTVHYVYVGQYGLQGYVLVPHSLVQRIFIGLLLLLRHKTRLIQAVFVRTHRECG